MKTLQKLLLMVPVIMVLASCKQTNVVPDENLTTCPTNGTCSALFTEEADINTQYMSLMTGIYRVFWYNYQVGGLSSKLYVKAPMEGTSFTLGKADILAGQVIFAQSCPSCNLIPLKAVDGYVKGKNMEPGKRSDQTRWLLEGKIILQGVNEPLAKDTLYFKQYFYPNFIYN